MIGAVARFFALARTKLARGPSSPPTLTIDRLADWYREQHAAAPEDAAVLETAVQLAVMCDRVDEARAMLGDRGPELGLRVVGEALIDPERAAREEGAYVAVLNDVLVETHDWTILDGDKIYNREAHARSLYKCPWVGNRTTPDRKQYLFKVLPPALTIDEPCIHLGSDANYAHWVERNLLKLALLEGSEYESLPLLLRAPVLPHQREFLDVMGIPDTRLVLAPTHLHYDHSGNHDLFPQARYHVQDEEMAYATGRCMCHPLLRIPFEADDVVAMVRKVFADRVRFYEGTWQLAPGITGHRIGGHSKGLQCVRVKTRRGPVVLASDASHLYAHMEEGRVFPVTYNVGEVLEGYDTLKRLAESPAHIIPGHDPDVARRYPAAAPGLEGSIVRLDVTPVA